MLVNIDIPSRVFNAPDGYRRLTINLPEEMHKKLKMVAVLRDCTVTEIIENCLKTELKMENK